MKRLLALCAFSLLLASPAMAADNDSWLVKDSLYFTMDDGVQTKDEMEQEAEYVYGFCTRNSYQSLYFDCKCIGGAFLLERERLGPMVLQKVILDRMTKTGKALCANTTAIAGQVYQDCMKYAETRRELATDNEEYCTCAANKMAREFTNAPRLNLSYIGNLRTTAMVQCINPETRDRISGSTKTGN